MDQTTYLERYKQIGEFKLEQTRRKGSDYAGTDNVFRNFELIEVLTGGRLTASDGFAVRLSDKLQRAVNLSARAAEVKNESILDTLIDLSAYAELWFLYLTRNDAELPLTQHGDKAPEEEQLPLVFGEDSGPLEIPEEEWNQNASEDVIAYLDAKARANEPVTNDAQYKSLLQRMLEKVGR